MAALKDVDPYQSPLAFFGHEVRRHRLRLELTQAQLSKRLYCSDDLVSMIETGEAVPTVEFGEACDEVFGTYGAMKSLAKMIRRTAVFPGWLRPWVDAEREAHTIRNWEPTVVPGLLRTEDYARAVPGLRPGVRREDLDEEVAARLGRKSIFDREKPPLAWFIIDEGVPHRLVGDPKVMHDQLKHLLEVSHHTNITIQVVPAGAQVPGLGGGYVIASLDGEPDVVYLESARAGHVADRSEDVREMMNVCEAIRAEALPVRASLELIAKVMEEQWT